MYMYLRSREAALHYNFLPQESAVMGNNLFLEEQILAFNSRSPV